MLDINTLIILAIVASIALGYFIKINIGIFAIIFAFILANMAGLSGGKQLALWPLNLFFILFSITYFYGFAIANGTLNRGAQHAIYMSRHSPWLMPVIFYLCVVVFSGIGPGHYAAFAFLSPLIMLIATQIRMSKMLAAVIVYSGACAGGFNPFTLGGRVVNGMLENLNIPAPLALHYTYAIGLSMFLAHTAIFAVSYVLLKGYRIQAVENMARPAPFSAEQKRTLWLVCGVFLLIILPALLSSLLPASTALKAATQALNPTFLSFIGIVASLLLKVADERKAMENIPWSIIIMICGLGMLINLAVDRGAVDQIANWVNGVQGEDSRGYGVVYIMGGLSSAMSLFASSMGAVMPTMFPIAAKIHTEHTALLFSVIAAFATFTGYSPFSSGGALVLAGVGNDAAESRRLFVQLIVLPIAVIICAALLLMLVLSLS
ncbi:MULTISPECIES: SLC13 family permease [Edwardsiella]|uniref:Dicarboxylate carrier MatC N-terminal domain-containing protein n=2 Tax=Hafniaceae TaxID=1903412 RepID=A0ABY8S9J4_9GAMM|nr:MULTISPECIES: SLC13 family permease [Edwardsiella]AKR77946.1 hypothetical protein AAZ33_10105 [Edwardsiella sp. LADL05-105]KAB0589601.1 hypothetical protein F7P84_14175 [Edwardsiella anguillarum]UOU77652.1 hypothetical protein MUN71_11305 [Edwardsiella anguillarum]WHP78889.1 hypothetical protein MQ090_10155 [Edwardsiella anguillarum]WHP82290.1 hypothetical protein MQ095_10765 [Edwardsiella anguillarum]